MLITGILHDHFLYALFDWLDNGVHSDLFYSRKKLVNNAQSSCFPKTHTWGSSVLWVWRKLPGCDWWWCWIWTGAELERKWSTTGLDWLSTKTLVGWEYPWLIFEKIEGYIGYLTIFGFKPASALTLGCRQSWLAGWCGLPEYRTGHRPDHRPDHHPDRHQNHLLGHHHLQKSVQLNCWAQTCKSTLTESTTHTASITIGVDGNGKEGRKKGNLKGHRFWVSWNTMMLWWETKLSSV